MNPDHDVDQLLAATGLDPDPAFVDRLQRGLTDELQRPTIRPVQRRRVALIAAAAAVAIGVGAVVAVAMNDTDDRTIVDAPDSTSIPTTVSPPNTIDASPTSPATTVVATTVTTAAPSTVVSTTQPTSTSTLPTAIVALVDLADVGDLVEPELIVSVPAPPAGDLFATALAAPSDGRLAVLDLGSGVVHFFDMVTGGELAAYPTPVPRVGDPRFIVSFFVGPDSILYAAEVGGEGVDNLPSLVAYSLTGDKYTEVFRGPWGALDGPMRQVNAGIDIATITPYVDAAGLPSGKTLGVDDVSSSGNGTNEVYTRGNRTWQVEYIRPDVPRGEECIMCIFWELGPDGSVVIPQSAPMPDGSIAQHITVLADTVTSFVTEWRYIGPQGDSLLFSRNDQDSIDIGRIRLSSLSGG